MKTEYIANKLSGLTSDLSSLLPENEMQLDAIRRVLGYNLRNKRQDISALKLEFAELEIETSKEKIQEFSKYAVTKLYNEDKFLVQRIGGKNVIPAVGVQIGDLRLPINPIGKPDELRWNQKRGEQIGPFLSESGQSIWFDLYYYEDKLTVRSQNDAVPHFLFSKAKSSIWLDAFNRGQTIRLKAGHVWILGKLFTNDTGANEYVGFNIIEGSFSISNKKKWNGQYLDFEGGFTGTLTIKLVQPENNTPVFEGCSAAQNIDFKYPDEITFDWKNGKLINIIGNNGEFKGYGNELVFSNFGILPIYETGLNHIFISCLSVPSKWKADFSSSQIFDATGTAEIKKSFWALPIVKVSNPTTLGEPENNGGWGLRLSSDITAKWIGSDDQQPVAIPNETLILLYPQALLLYSEKTTVDINSTSEIKQDFSCWQLSSENSARIPLSLSYKDEFLLIYYCHSSEGETIMAGCNGQIQPDRPVFAEGSHIAMKDLKGWISFQAKGLKIKINAFLGNQEELKKPAKLLALENAIVTISPPSGLFLEGTLSGNNNNSIGMGLLTLFHGLLRWKPILPDPYVSNLKNAWGMTERESSGAFTSVLFARISWDQPDRPIVSFIGALPLSGGVGIKSPSQPSINFLPAQLDERTIKDIKANEINEKQRQNKNAADLVFEDFEKRLSGWKLLDVSTNMDLIGVSVSPSLFQSKEGTSFVTALTKNVPSTGNAFTIKELAVNTPLSMVHVFTVPQVQWEPVRTLPEDQNIAALGWFPDYLSSSSDGGPTRVIGISQELSPIIPDIAVRRINENFTKGKPAVALTTLSFGLKAVVKLSPQNSPNRNADSLNILQPGFPQKKMKGGIQISMMAESNNPKYDTHSPGFEGFMTQTLNGYELFTGTELGLSVLGATFQPDASVETQFNEEFSSVGSNPFVPVTRFDLSGYGASNFSEWDNPGALASIGKVQFKIMVGRTAFEVVKFVSKIYPWGTTVTRTITIERRSGGGLIRRDSGWQATQSGIFDFRVTGIPNNPYVFRPGVFKGCFNLKNIRPASNNIITFNDPANGNNIEMAPVYFDANVNFDGQVDANIFSKGVLGFIQLAPKPDTTVDPWMPQLLSKEALKKLIHDQGAIGGPIDTMLNIGSSGFMFRATRFEVDVTDNSGTPNFTGVIRGQPALPNNGSWSVVKIAAPGNLADPQEATSADVTRGTPLFIENSWNPPSGNVMNVSGPAGPYRFADPVDLFVPQPRYDYGFMQNTGSQALLFRRPVIISGTNELSSNLKPAFADPFAMLTSKGVFPPVANAIEFPTTNELVIQSGTNKLRLNSPVNLHNLRNPLVIAQDGTDQIAIEYDQSDLKINLNFDDWNVELDNFFIWTSLVGISKLSGTRFSLRAGTLQQSKLVNVRSLLKPEIQDALNFLPGMGSPAEIGEIDLGMTNGKHEVKVHTGFEKKLELPAPFDKIELSFSGSAGVDSESDTTTGVWQAFFGATIGAELQGKIPILSVGAADIFLVLGLELEAGFGTEVSPTASSDVSLGFKSFEITAYVGVGVEGGIGPFKAEAFIAVGVVFVYEDDTAKLGGIVMLEAEVDLKILSIKISAELKGIIYKDGSDTLCDASGEVAVNVTILFFSIEASYGYTTTQQL